MGSYCIRMTSQEAEQQRIRRRTELAPSRIESQENQLDNERINLSEVSKNCDVYRYDENYGELDCNDYKFDEFERNCEAYFSHEDEVEGEIECQGSDYKSFERLCTVLMYSDDYGEVEC